MAFEYLNAGLHARFKVPVGTVLKLAPLGIQSSARATSSVSGLGTWSAGSATPITIGPFLVDTEIVVEVLAGIVAAEVDLATSSDAVKSDNSTNNNASITAMVAAAKLAGARCEIPAGTAVTTTSIPGLHDVPWVGTGGIKRGTAIFYPNPRFNQVNTLYVAPSGWTPPAGALAASDLNDGLSVNEPLATIQRAFDVMSNYGPILDGSWQIGLIDGSHAGGASLPAGLRSLNYIKVFGVSNGALPYIPKATIDAAVSGGATYALNANGNNSVWIDTVAVKGFVNAGNGFGIVSQLFGVVYLRNCYFTNNDLNVKIQQGRLLVEGGVYVGGSVNLTAISNETHSIGYNATVLQPVNVPILSASGDGTTATLTIAAQATAPIVGGTVCVGGMTPAGYNGVFVVTASTTTSVSFANTTTGAMTVAGALGYNYGCPGVGPLFANATTCQILLQEGALGHVDFTACCGGGVGVDALVGGSRANFNNSSVSFAASVGVRRRAAGTANNGLTFYGNVLDEQNGIGGFEINREGFWTNEARQAADTTQADNTGSTTNNVMKTYPSAIKANSFTSNVKTYRTRFSGPIVGNGGTKTVQVLIDTTVIATFVIPAAAVDFDINVWMPARNSTSQRLVATCRCNGQLTQQIVSSPLITVKTGVDMAMSIKCQNQVGTDKLSIWLVEQFSAGGC